MTIKNYHCFANEVFAFTSFIRVSLNNTLPAGVAEWFAAPCLLRVAQTVVGLSPGPNLHQCLWTHLQVHGLKRLGCHADLYTVSRCRTRGESEDQSEKAHKGSALALKPSTDVTQSSKQRYQWPHEKDLSPPKLFLKKKVGNIVDKGFHRKSKIIQQKKIVSSEDRTQNLF